MHVKLVINSHTRSFVALAHLLESLRILPEFKEYEIIIIVGGNYNHAAYEIDKVANVTYIRAQQNSMNFTGLIALLENYHENEADYYMFMHDTTRAGPAFF